MIELHVIAHFISIIFHGVIITCTCFFFEVPRIEELQDPDSGPRREEVGRRTLRDYGGFLPPIFLSGEVSIVHYFKNYKLGKLVLTRLQSPREWKNRTRLDEHYFFYYPIPPEDEF